MEEDNIYHEIIKNILNYDIDYYIEDKKQLKELNKYYLENKKQILKTEYKHEYKNVRKKKLLTGVFFASVILIPSLNGFVSNMPIYLRTSYTVATGAIVGLAVNKVYNEVISRKADKEINNYINGCLQNKEERPLVKKLEK